MIKEKYSEFKSESEKQQERGTVEMEESVDLFGESYDVETTTTQEAVLALESFKAMIFAKYKDNSGSDSRLDSLSESDMGVSNYFESKAVANFEASVQEANNTQDNNTLDALEAKNKDLIDEAEKFCG